MRGCLSTGTGSHVYLNAKNREDAIIMRKDGRATREKGRPLAITIIHELIHALNFAHGRNKGNLKATAEYVWEDGKKYKPTSSLEELYTIGVPGFESGRTSENHVRESLKMRPRVSHMAAPDAPNDGRNQ
jgi:Effector protein